MYCLLFIMSWLVIGAASHIGSVLLARGEYCGENVTDTIFLSIMGPLCTCMVLFELFSDKISTWQRRNRNKVLFSIKRKGE